MCPPILLIKPSLSIYNAQKKRKQQVKKIMAKSPFDVEIINVVDSATLSLQEINEHYSETPIHQPLYPFPLNTGEVGCFFLSHRNA